MGLIASLLYSVMTHLITMRCYSRMGCAVLTGGQQLFQSRCSKVAREGHLWITEESEYCAAEKLVVEVRCEVVVD